MGTYVQTHMGSSAEFPRVKAACLLVGRCRSPGAAQEDIWDLRTLQVTQGKGYEWDTRTAHATPGLLLSCRDERTVHWRSPGACRGGKTHICQKRGACQGQTARSGTLKLALLLSLPLPLSLLKPIKEMRALRWGNASMDTSITAVTPASSASIGMPLATQCWAGLL